MSKAFTKEGDDDGETELPPYVAPWPAGARNYISPDGHARLRSERDAIVAALPELATAARAATPRDAPTAKAQLSEARRRLEQLEVHLEAAEIVPPIDRPTQVQLGVTVRVSGDRERSYTIVGVDEVDVAKGHVSWLSPIARALSGARVGDTVELRFPKGSPKTSEELVVVAITGGGPR